MHRSFGTRSRVAMGLVAIVATGCRDYAALDRTNDAAAPDAATLFDGGPVMPDAALDLARFGCDQGILCETFDNDPIGDGWTAIPSPSGTIDIEKTVSFAGPSSLETDVPMLTESSIDPSITHPLVLTSASSALNAREMIYFTSLSAPIDLFRFTASNMNGALVLQAVPGSGMNAKLLATSTAGGSAMNTFALPPNQWNCIEWTLTLGSSGSSSVSSTVLVNHTVSGSQTALTNPFLLAPDTIVLGDAVNGDYAGATYFIDSLVVTDNAQPIGCQ